MTLPSIAGPHLQATCTGAAATLTAALSGSADAPIDSGLDKFITELHAAAVESKVERVDIQLKDLKFMTSSCFKIFVTWLTTVRELPEPARYHIRFLTHANHHWQRRSMAALAAFGGDGVEVVL